MKVFILLCIVGLASTQFLDNLQNKVVLQVDAEEAQLPPHLLNPFYRNPRIRSALAKSSWFGPGEGKVVHRAADNVSRKEIHKILNHAGLLPQQRL